MTQCAVRYPSALVIIIAIIAVLAGPAVARDVGPVRPHVDGDQLAQGRAMTGPEARQAIVGRMLHIVRDPPSGDRAVKIAMWAVYRPDGSWLFKCEVLREDGDWVLCSGGKRFPSGIRGWLVGLCRIDGDLLCAKRAHQDWKEETCYRLRADGLSAVHIEQARGRKRSVFVGRFQLLPMKNLQCVGILKGAGC